MEKLLHSYNKASESKTHRFVFKNVEKPAAQPASGEPQKPGFMQEFKQEYNTELNVQTAFTDNPDEVFAKLAEEAKKTNPALTAESIKQNFMDTLQAGKNLEEAWQYLKTKDAQTAAIIQGLLRFFAGNVNSKEISLTEFFKPQEMKIGGEGTLTYKYLQVRQRFLAQSMQSLAALKGELPELPPNKYS